MIAGLDGVGDLLGNEYRTHWKTARERLGQRHHVRRHSEALVRHESAESAKTALNLVEDEGDSALSGDLANEPQELRIENPHATLTLYRLDDDCRHCFAIERRSLGGEAKQVGHGWSPDVSPDGRTLIYAKRTDAEWDLVVKPFDSDAEPVVYQGGAGWQVGPRFSPDGRFVAYTSIEGGHGDVYVAPFPAGQKRRVTTDGGYWPVWSRDGRRLYFGRGTGVMAIDVAAGDSFAVGTPVEILPQGTLAYLLAARFPTPFDVSSDGTRFVIQRQLPQVAGVEAVAHVLLEWLQRPARGPIP